MQCLIMIISETVPFGFCGTIQVFVNVLNGDKSRVTYLVVVIFSEFIFSKDCFVHILLLFLPGWFPISYEFIIQEYVSAKD